MDRVGFVHTCTCSVSKLSKGHILCHRRGHKGSYTDRYNRGRVFIHQKVAAELRRYLNELTCWFGVDTGVWRCTCWSGVEGACTQPLSSI